MKMRKKLAALLAAAMIASVMPMSAFAASTNRMNKTVNVKKDTTLTSDRGVELVIKMADGDKFEDGRFFVLKATDAKWDKGELVAAYGSDTVYFNISGTPVTATTTPGLNTNQLAYSIRRESNSSLIVTAHTTVTGSFRIPMVAVISGDAPTVELEPYDSAVSADKLGLVQAATGKAIVTVGSAPTIAGTDKMATISFDEPFIGSFKPGQKITLELRDSDFSFVNKGTVAGTKNYYNGFSASDVDFVGDKLVITIPSGLNQDQRGGFDLKDVQIRPSRDAREGEVRVTIEGDLVDKDVLTVAKYGDFTTSLKVKKDDYNVVAGQEIDVEFTLSEDMKNAIISDRAATFTFSKDIVIHDISVVSKEVQKDSSGDDLVVVPQVIFDRDDKRTNVFEVDNFYPNIDKKSSYEFKATLYVPAKYEGEIALEAEGRAFADELTAIVATTEAPVTVKGTSTVLKVGVQKQVTDAKIVIAETAKDRLTHDDLFIEIADKDSGITITGADIAVTEGDLELGKINYNKVDGIITIPVKRYSTEPSTIEITNITFKTDRTVPEGAYDVKVSGTALSKLETTKKDGKSYEISSEVAKLKDLVVIGTPNTEDINKGKKAVVNFVIGSGKFLVDGKEVEMDAAPYIKDGRTMVPLRYLSEALGVDTESIKFNSGLVTIFDEARVIQVHVGSKNLVVNGMSIPMVAAAEIIEGRTYVPVTEIGGVFGVSGSWDAETQTATFQPTNN